MDKNFHQIYKELVVSKEEILTLLKELTDDPTMPRNILGVLGSPQPGVGQEGYDIFGGGHRYPPEGGRFGNSTTTM